MQFLHLVGFLVAAHTGGVDARLLKKSRAGNCPSGLSVLRRIELERVEWVGGASTHTEFAVADVPDGTRLVEGLGPHFESGYRYLLFDAVRTGGLNGVGCHVQSKVRCLAASPGAAQPTAASECGAVCEPDTSVQGLQYVSNQLGGALAALAKGRHGAGSAQPSSVAVVGVGAGSMPSWLARAFPAAHLDIVDFEPEVIRAAVDCFGLPASGGRIQHHAAEGAAFLRAGGRAYDLVLIDVPPLPAGFVEVVPAIRARLSAGGVLAVNGFESDKRWPRFIEAVACAFPSVWLEGGSGNQILVASTEPGVSLAGGNSTALKALGVAPEIVRWAAAPAWHAVPACSA